MFTFLTFFIPDFSEGGKLIWAYVTYCLLCTAYTVVNIPLNTIVPRLTADPHERNCLVATRMVCAMLGTAVVMSITTPLVRFFGQGDQAKGYLVTMTVYGIAAMVIFFLTFASTKEVIPPAVEEQNSTLKENFKGMTGQAWLLMVFNFLYFALYVIRSTTVLYYFTYNLQKVEWITLVGLLGILSGLPMLLCLPALQRKFGKRNVMFLSIAIYVAGDLLIYLGKSSALCLLGGLVITGLGIYGIFGTVFAMQPDVIDYSEYKKNRSISGMIAAFQGFFVKGSMGLASWIIGKFLESSGYIPNVRQTPQALASIEVSFIWVPLILCVLLAVTTLFYKLDACADAMRTELNARRARLEEKMV